MSDASETKTGLNVFISYSRDDVKFADQLVAALKLFGYDPIIDRSMPGGVEWQESLRRSILQSDTVVFILSPSSLASHWAGWEVDRAVEFGKRIVPVVCRPLAGAKSPEKLSAHNNVYFYDEPDIPGSGFGQGISRLVEAPKYEPDWMQDHRRYLQRAMEWDGGGRPANRLLSGDDIGLAKRWAARRPKDAPPPTTLHLDYIRASEEWDAQQTSERQQQLKEREGLVRERESAQAERDAAARRVVQRTLMGATAAVLLALLAGALWLQARADRNKARASAEEANVARAAAEQQRREAESARRVADLEAARAKAARDKVIQYIEKIAAQAALLQADKIKPLEKRISPEALEMIVRYETGGRSYYETYYKMAPVWPGYSSGVTIGFGYDLGYVNEEEFAEVWRPYLIPDDLQRMQKATGVTGGAAQAIAAELKDVIIPWAAADIVFKTNTLPKFLGQFDAALPNTDKLPPHCTGAMLSLVFNRGADFKSTSDKRLEMRNIRAYFERWELEKVPDELRAMKRHWTSQGLRERRDEEATLFEACLTGMTDAVGALARGAKLLRDGSEEDARAQF